MLRSKLNLASLMAMAAIASVPSHAKKTRPLSRSFKAQAATPVYSRSKRYPQMVTSSDEAIALHNATLSTRQVRRHRARHA